MPRTNALAYWSHSGVTKKMNVVNTHPDPPLNGRILTLYNRQYKPELDNHSSFFGSFVCDDPQYPKHFVFFITYKMVPKAIIMFYYT